MTCELIESNVSIGSEYKLNDGSQEGSGVEKAVSPEKSIATTTTTNFMDINIDCLESIFGYLGLSDLLSVSDSNNHMKSAAELIYLRKYGAQKIRLNLFPHSPATSPLVNEQSNEIIISNSKMCFQILRCFGHLIRNLHITGDRFVRCETRENIIVASRNQNTTRLIGYMIKYCSKFVTEITFEKLNEAALVHITDEFPLVETVRYEYCDVKMGFTHLNQVFPKLRLLKLLWTDVIGMKVHIPTLERLVIDLPINLNTLQKEHIETMIELNPQLQSLKLYFFWNTEFLRSISRHSKAIENLEIVCGFSDSDIYNAEKIHFKGVKHFAIQSIAVPKVTFSFDHLEEFDTNCWWTEANIDLMKKYTSITKLITSQSDSRFRFIISDEIAMKMAKALPLLKELVINYKEISVGEAVCVLKRFESLDRIQFTMEHRSDFDVLLPILSKKWSANVSKENNVLFDRIAV